jgi:hypothetical protein
LKGVKIMGAPELPLVDEVGCLLVVAVHPRGEGLGDDLLQAQIAVIRVLGFY